ncbi:MFS transporter [Bradyrhizobium elkanii]|uniref:MFS transporter n=1 Tax=Bradyrhizobium elkanii TaxID=29448 RepID=UPI003513FCBD
MDQENRIGQGRAWTVVALLFFYTMINFFDRLVLGLSAVPVMRELSLTPAQYGLIASGVYWLYAVSGVAVGLFLVNRVSTKWLLVGLVLIWSVAQVPAALTSSLSVLIACRVLLGIGEGPGSPSAYEACHSWFPPEKRNLPTAIFLQGAPVAFLVGAPFLSWVIVEYGWRFSLLLCSSLGVIWIVAWFALAKDGPFSGSAAKACAAGDQAVSPVPWAALWLDRTMIGNYVLGFSSYWIVGVTVAWQAPYLQMGLGYDGKVVGWLIAAMTAAQPFVLLTISYLSERALGNGASSRVARGAVNAACLVASGILLAAAMMIEGAGFTKLALLALGTTLPSVTTVLGAAMVSEIAPTSQRGTALLVTYSAITVAGLLSPLTMGYAVQAAGQAEGFVYGYLIAAALLVLAGTLGFLLLDPEESKRRLNAISSESQVDRQSSSQLGVSHAG